MATQNSLTLSPVCCKAHSSPIPAYYLPRLHALNIGRFTLAKAKSRRYHASMIMDVDNTDDIALLANTPAKPESLQHCLKWVASGIGFHVNADKTEFMCFNQRGNISTLNGRSLKLVDKFTYLRNSTSSIKNDINTWLAKAWTAINRLSVIWKSDLSDEIKRSFSKQWSYQYCCMDAPHGCWLSVWRESLTEIAQECCELYWTSPESSIPQNRSCMDTYHPFWKPCKLDKQDKRNTAGEVRASS